METKSSEFGKGFIYNLILFAKHWDVHNAMRKSFRERGEKDKFYPLWFSGASDHFYEIEVPSVFKRTKIGKMVKELKDTCLDLGHGKGLMGEIEVTEKDFNRVFELLESIALEIDKYFDVNPIKADWN